MDNSIKRHPALVLIAGDFAYHLSEDEPEDIERDEFLAFDDEINEAVELVRPLVEAYIPIYAVLGDHHYGMPQLTPTNNEPLARVVHKSLEAIGVRVLNHEAVPPTLAQHGSANDAMKVNPSLYLVGIGSRFANNDKVSAALAQMPDGAPRLAMMHNPDSFESFPAGAAPLAVTGRTHARGANPRAVCARLIFNGLNDQ